jgi:predicted DNA-binding transcriptional regulator AlpA
MQEITFEQLPKAVTQLSNEVSEIKRLLLEKGNLQLTESDRWFDINELCNYLPDRPAKKTIYKWVSDRTIPYYKGTKALRFFKPEIDTWLKEGKSETKQEIIAQLDNGCLLPIKRREVSYARA